MIEIYFNFISNDLKKLYKIWHHAINIFFYHTTLTNSDDNYQSFVQHHMITQDINIFLMQFFESFYTN